MFPCFEANDLAGRGLEASFFSFLLVRCRTEGFVTVRQVYSLVAWSEIVMEFVFHPEE